MSTDLPGRLLRLLSLLQTRRTWPGAELAARLGVTDRTLRRDVERLRGLDYPVEATTGTAGGYRLTSGHNLPRCCSTTTRRSRRRSRWPPQPLAARGQRTPRCGR